MKQNMGSIDRFVRILAAVTMVVLYRTSAISGVLAIVLLSLAVVFLLTSLVSFCPLYFPFGISTKGSSTDEYAD